MKFKFKKDEIVYIVKKHRFKSNEYIKCTIHSSYRERYNNDSIIVNKYFVLKEGDNKLYKPIIFYVPYLENELIDLREYRRLKLKKLSGKKYLKFSPKKFFEFNYLTLFRKK